MHVVSNGRDAKTYFIILLQAQSVSETMPKKRKKKDKDVDDESDVEIMPRVEIVYEDTKYVIGAKFEYKWGHIYHMLRDQKVPDACLEDLTLYDNILRSGITKVSTRP